MPERELAARREDQARVGQAWFGIDGDVVGLVRLHAEAHAAADPARRGVVLADERELIHARAFVDGEERVEVVARFGRGDLDPERAVGRGRVLVPHARRAGVAGVGGLARLLRRVTVRRGENRVGPLKSDRAAEEVVGRPLLELPAQPGGTAHAGRAVQRDLVPLVGEHGEADGARRAVLVGGDGRERAHGRAGVDGEQSVEAAAGGGELDDAARRRRPRVPERAAARVAGVGGLARLLRRILARARDLAGRRGARDGGRVREAVVGGGEAELPGERVAAARPARPVDGDLVAHARGHGEVDGARLAVGVGGDGRQRADGRAGVGRDQRVEGGARRGELGAAARRGRPREPDGLAARVAGVGGLARLLRRAAAVAREVAGVVRERGRLGEAVVDGRRGRRRRRRGADLRRGVGREVFGDDDVVEGPVLELVLGGVRGDDGGEVGDALLRGDAQVVERAAEPDVERRRRRLLEQRDHVAARRELPVAADGRLQLVHDGGARLQVDREEARLVLRRDVLDGEGAVARVGPPAPRDAAEGVVGVSRRRLRQQLRVVSLRARRRVEEEQLVRGDGVVVDDARVEEVLGVGAEVHDGVGVVVRELVEREGLLPGGHVHLVEPHVVHADALEPKHEALVVLAEAEPDVAGAGHFGREDRGAAADLLDGDLDGRLLRVAADDLLADDVGLERRSGGAIGVHGRKHALLRVLVVADLRAAAVHARRGERRGAGPAAEGVDEDGREGREREDRQQGKRHAEDAKASPRRNHLFVMTPMMFAEHVCCATAARASKSAPRGLLPPLDLSARSPHTLSSLVAGPGSTRRVHKLRARLQNA